MLLALLGLHLLDELGFLLLRLGLKVGYPGPRLQVARVELGLGRLTCLDPRGRHYRCIRRLLT